MANKHGTLSDLFAAIADAIRSKTGATGKIVADNFPDAISNMQVGGDASGATVLEALTLENADAGFYMDGFGSGGATDKGVYLKLTIGADSENVLLGPGTVLTMRSQAENFGTATAADVAVGKTFTSANGLLQNGTHECSAGGVATASGAITVNESCSSFTIDTGLTTVDTITVVRAEVPSEESGTWGWLSSPAGNLTNYFSYGATLSWRYGVDTSKITFSSGKATVNRYSANYPVLPGTYNWIAYGTK